jgi:hypothetical protein
VQNPRIILPNEHVAEHGLIRVTPQPLEPVDVGAEVLRALGVSAAFVAVGELPSFADQIHTYARHQDFAEIIFEQELASYLGVGEATEADVLRHVRSLPFEAAMRWTAMVQKALWPDRTDPAKQREMLRGIYGDGAIALAGEILLAHGERTTIFSEQQLFALQRLLVLEAEDRDVEEFSSVEHIAIRLALYYIPGTILQLDEDFDDNEGEPGSAEDERWLRYFVGSGGLVGHATLRHELARAHMLYEVIAKSRAAKRHRDFCPLDQWLHDAYGGSFVELQAMGFGLYVGSKFVDPAGPPVAVLPDYFDPTELAGRIDRLFTAISADRAWYRQQFQASSEHPRRAAYEIHPFLQRPALKEDSGHLIVLAPRAVESWLSANGAYYRFMDIARARGQTTFDRFLRFNGWLQERYARHVVHVAHPHQEARRRFDAAGVVIPEQVYRVRRQEMRTTDVVIDLKTDLVLIEITAKRVTRSSLIEAAADDVRNDLQGLVIDKMVQLGRVIRHVAAGEAVLPGVDFERVERVWPIIVTGDNLFQNPSLWAYANREGGHHLAPTREECRARVQPLLLVDFEELERLMGIVAEGGSLVTVLERKTAPMWRERDFKIWHTDDPGRVGSGENAYIGEELRRAFRSVVRALALRR